MAAPRIIDYGRIEPGWRAGKLSVQQLADEYESDTGKSVSRRAIQDHFKALGIPRDLSEKIKAKADAMVAGAMVAGKVAVTGDETLPAEAAIIASAATTSANVQLSHRADIKKFRARVGKYEQELNDFESEEKKSIESLGKRAGILKMLSETQVKLIAAEREAFGMDSDKPTESGLSGESAATLKRLKAALEAG